MRILILITCFTLFFSSQSHAQSRADADAYKTYLEKIETYLNSITTLAAAFTQEDSDGGHASGMFYLSRPGSLRWEYDQPTPIVIVVRGSLVAYHDKELDQVSHISIDDTMASFLTRKDIKLNKGGVEVTRFDMYPDRVSITIAEKDKDNGELTMVFRENPFELSQLIVKDAIGKEIAITFEAIIYDKPLGRELFNMPTTQRRR